MKNNFLHEENKIKNVLGMKHLYYASIISLFVMLFGAVFGVIFDNYCLQLDIQEFAVGWIFSLLAIVVSVLVFCLALLSEVIDWIKIIVNRKDTCKISTYPTHFSLWIGLLGLLTMGVSLGLSYLGSLGSMVNSAGLSLDAVLNLWDVTTLCYGICICFLFISALAKSICAATIDNTLKNESLVNGRYGATNDLN
jgi:hypothetical protein